MSRIAVQESMTIRKSDSVVWEKARNNNRTAIEDLEEILGESIEFHQYELMALEGQSVGHCINRAIRLQREVAQRIFSIQESKRRFGK